MLTLPGQKSLFDERTPHHNRTMLQVESAPHSGSETSRAAAVYRFILARREHGATDCEVQDGLGMAGNTQRPRRQELEKSGLIVKTDRTRATSSGRQAAVWVAKKFSDVPL